MAIRFSASAIKANFLVENPDWYQYKCVDVKNKPATTGSKNYFYVFEGLNGEMLGVQVAKMANEKADWIHYPIFKAANGGVDLAPDTEVNPEDMKDVVLEAFTKRGQRQDGTPMNDLVEFRPVQKGQNMKLSADIIEEEDAEDPFEEPVNPVAVEDEDVEDPFEDDTEDEDSKDEEDPFEVEDPDDVA